MTVNEHDEVQAALGHSGVRARCRCGRESGYHRVLALPREHGWTIRWVVVRGQSWPYYLCPPCAEAARSEPTRAPGVETAERRLQRLRDEEAIARAARGRRRLRRRK